MNMHVEGNTDTDPPVTAGFAASLEFAPWQRGAETPMTVSGLLSVASQHFFSTCLAYETMFKSRDDLANSFKDDDTAGALLDLVERIECSLQWFEMLTNMMQGARCRVIAAASYSEVEGHLPEAA